MTHPAENDALMAAFRAARDEVPATEARVLHNAERAAPSESVWIDQGDPDCDGEPRWTQDKSGKRTFTCPKCSLHWYYVIPPAKQADRTPLPDLRPRRGHVRGISEAEHRDHAARIGADYGRELSEQDHPIPPAGAGSDG